MEANGQGEAARGRSPRSRLAGWPSERIARAIAEWRDEHGRYPHTTDWRSAASEHPSLPTVINHFGSWEAAIEEARRRRAVKVPLVIPPAHVDLTLAAMPEREAEDARAAVEWIGGGEEGAALEISRARLQRFLWYSLPRKWLVGLADHLRVTEALGRFFRLLPEQERVPDYADICESEETRELLVMYAGDSERAFERFLELELESGVEPPDVPALTWGGVMGLDEATARDHVGLVLERAIEEGELEPGRGRWRTKQERLTERALNEPWPEREGAIPLELIEAERLEARRARMEPLELERLDAAWPAISAARSLSLDRAAAVAEPLRWLLETARERDGLKLTAKRALSRAFVQEAAERYPGWWHDAEVFGPPRLEAEVVPLAELHAAARGAKLLARRSGVLRVGPKGRGCLADARVLCDAAAAMLVGGDFDGALREQVLLALLADGAEVSRGDLEDELHPILAGRWHQPDGGELPSLRYMVFPVMWLATALGVCDRGELGAGTLSLTEPGRDLAARALWRSLTSPQRL